VARSFIRRNRIVNPAGIRRHHFGPTELREIRFLIRRELQEKNRLCSGGQSYLLLLPSLQNSSDYPASASLHFEARQGMNLVTEDLPD
jgi:hypothetical protein